MCIAAPSAAGDDPRHSRTVNRARAEAISEGHRRNRSWAREHPGQRDEAWLKREIASKLDARTPHPSHWVALQNLTDS